MSDDSHEFDLSDEFDMPEETKQWPNLRELGKDAYNFIDEMLVDLKPLIDANHIRVELENQKYFDLLESKYPIGQNRIDWRGVRNHLALEVLQVGEIVDLRNRIDRLITCRDILVEWLNSFEVEIKDEVVVVGDDCNWSLYMTIETLLDCYQVVFNYPEHHYVLPSTGKWCINYTMEGELFMGAADQSIVTGTVDMDSVDYG